jgi:hypothetical protein
LEGDITGKVIIHKQKWGQLADMFENFQGNYCFSATGKYSLQFLTFPASLVFLKASEDFA